MLKFNQIRELTNESGGSFYTVDIAVAEQLCKKITRDHYENFPVASFLIPGNLRRHVYPIYAFARIADDIADENPEISPDEKFELLSQYKTNFLTFHADKGNPVFLLLHKTISELSLPIDPFIKLLDAFRRDILFEQPLSLDENLDYCSYSANPVGELILRLFGEYDPEKGKLSDDLCTALQLANFWQDISIDRLRGRCYIPADILNKHNLSIDGYFGNSNKSVFGDCLNELFDYTHNLFHSGRKLIPKINSFRLRQELKLTILGGEAILEKCRKISTDLFTTRPKISKLDFFSIFARYLLFKENNGSYNI